ncbi:hypothetical protein GALL_449710 [mine drainage metagenome]|uniref:Uncharacterized protein n=1 Tax=mine drainage metagenome TaxID=410659 RepID=A0A1J5Q041_9ZZZZ
MKYISPSVAISDKGTATPGISVADMRPRNM